MQVADRSFCFSMLDGAELRRVIQAGGLKAVPEVKAPRVLPAGADAGAALAALIVRLAPSR